MKKFYLSVLTLLTISNANAALSAELFERGDRTPSESGSFGSRATTSMLGKHVPYAYDESREDTDILGEYHKLSVAYTELLTIANTTDARLTQFVQTLESVLPGGIEQRSEAGEDNLQLVRKAFSQLRQMYNVLNQSYSKKKGSVTLLESQIEQLREQNAAYQKTMQTLVKRPTEHIQTDMSPERVQKYREDDAMNTEAFTRLERANRDQLDALTALEATVEQKDAKIANLTAAMQTVNAETLELREKLNGAEARLARGDRGKLAEDLATAEANLAKLMAERDAAVANAAAEKQRADAEKQRADAAEAKARQRAAAGGNESDRLLDSGDSINGGSRRQKKDDGCPACVVM